MPAEAKLNIKMKMFCHNIMNGDNQTEAYQKAYDNPNIVSCRVAGSALMKNPLVIEYMHELEKVRFASADEECKSAKAELWKIALDENEATGNRIRALDIINKMNAVYSDTNTGGEQTTNINFGDMSADDLKKLIVSQEETDGAE